LSDRGDSPAQETWEAFARPGGEGWLARRDARPKLAALVVFVVCVAVTPAGQWQRLAWFAGLCFFLVVVAEVRFGWLARRLLLALPLVALVGLSVLLANPRGAEDALFVPLLGRAISAAALARLGGAAAKAVICLAAVAAVMHTITFHDFVHALHSARLPRMVSLTLSFTYRYLTTLAEEGGRMVRARDLRGRPPRIADRARVTGWIAGSLFLRSHERSRRVGQAMVLRGFDGTLRRLAQPRPSAGDVLLGVAFAALSLWLAVV